MQHKIYAGVPVSKCSLHTLKIASLVFATGLTISYL